QPSALSVGVDGYRCAPPILVSARPAKVRAFRKEWPRPGWPPGPGRRSLDRNPSKHCELIFVAGSRSASSSRPALLNEHQARIQGRIEKMSKRSIICAGIDTGKYKLDAALIAACTSDVRTIHAPPDRRLAELAELQTQIDQVVRAMARFKNHRESCRDAGLRQLWDDEIRRFRGLFRQRLKQLVAAI